MDLTPMVKEKLGKAAEMVIEKVPLGKEIAAELGNRVSEAKGFLGKMFSDFGKEFDHQVASGAHELAAAIYRGDPFVMYPHADQQKEQEAPQHGLPPEVTKQVEAPQQERGVEMEM